MGAVRQQEPIANRPAHHLLQYAETKQSRQIRASAASCEVHTHSLSVATLSGVGGRLRATSGSDIDHQIFSVPALQWLPMEPEAKLGEADLG